MSDGKKIDAFSGQFRFRGRTAKYVLSLCDVFEKKTKAQLFANNVNIFIIAPLVGFTFHQTAIPDTEKNDVGKVWATSVFDEQMNRYKMVMEFNLKLIMLLDEEYEPNEEKRIDKALRNFMEDQKDIDRYFSYMYGGIDILYDKLVKNAVSSDDFIERMNKFCNELMENYNKAYDKDEILNLCQVN